MIYIQKAAYQFAKIKFLYSIIKNNRGFISGGVFKDLFLDKKPRDIDVFFRNEFDFYMASNNNINLESMELIYENENAIGYHNKILGLNIDFVRKSFGSPQEIMNEFDFTVTQFSLFEEDGVFKVLYQSDYFEDLMNKRLKWNKDFDNPVSLVQRCMRYSGYGFKPVKKDFIDLLYELNQLEDDEFKRLSLMNYYQYY